jgi:ribosomal protein L17
MAGRIFEECGCEYYRTDGGSERIYQRCKRHEDQENSLNAAEAAEYERLGERGYWR